MSANSGPIQVIPPGLLNLLQIKNSGRLPDELVGNYQPTIEMRDWLLLFNSETQKYTPGGAAAGATFTAFEFVPQDEWWYLHEASGWMVYGVGSTYAAAGLAFEATTAARGVLFCQSSWAGAATANVQSLPFNRGGGVWVPPGSEIRFYRDSNIAPPANSTIDLRLTRLPI